MTHKGYSRNKLVIGELVREPDAYPERIENREYLDDELIKAVYGKAAPIYDDFWSGTWPYEISEGILDWLDVKPGIESSSWRRNRQQFGSYARLL